MATEFTASVASASGDYTTLNAAIAGLANDLTVATILVFSISSATATPPQPGDALIGLTSTATGTCVLVNAAKTQILIKAISGTFQNGETVKKVTDVTKEVVLSNAGDSPIVGLKCSNFVDTTKATVSGFTCTATNYVRIYAADNHNGLYGTSSYRLETIDSTGTGSLYVNQDFTLVQGLLVANTTDDDDTCGIMAANTATTHLERCIVKNTHPAAVHGNSAYGIGSVGGDRTKILYVSNCIVLWRWGRTGTNGTAAFTGSSSATANFCYFYNCTAIGDGFNIGFQSQFTDVVVKNCLAYNFATGSNFSTGGSFGTASDYNASSDTTYGARGSNSRVSQTFTFVNAGSDNYQLASSDAGAKGFGTNLSGDATYPISVDVENTARSVPWDIGAWLAAASSGPPPFLPEAFGFPTLSGVH